MSINTKIYTAAEVASAGFSKEEIDQTLSTITQKAYKAAKRGENNVTYYNTNPHLLDRVAVRLRGLGYFTKVTKRAVGSNYLTIHWGSAETLERGTK